MTRRYAGGVGIAALVVGLDLVTKRWAAIHFQGDRLEVIPGLLDFTFVENPGAAFSLFQDAGVFLAVAAILVSAALLWSLRHTRPGLEVVAFGLIIGGALGNFTDRLLRGPGALDGRVIDWIDLWRIPTFNVADMSITIAVGLLLIQAWLAR